MINKMIVGSNRPPVTVDEHGNERRIILSHIGEEFAEGSPAPPRSPGPRSPPRTPPILDRRGLPSLPSCQLPCPPCRAFGSVQWGWTAGGE